LKTNPLRILDSIEEKTIELNQNAPDTLSHLCTECKKHFKEVLEYLEKMEIPYNINKCLVRGLSYYTRTVIEIMIDDEVKKIVQSGMDKAERILNENADKLHKMSEALLEREILDSVEIDMLMRGEELPPFENLNLNKEVLQNTELKTGKEIKEKDEKFAPGDVALAN
jgi:hypothetical protein